MRGSRRRQSKHVGWLLSSEARASFLPQALSTPMPNSGKQYPGPTSTTTEQSLSRESLMASDRTIRASNAVFSQRQRQQTLYQRKLEVAQILASRRQSSGKKG
jgi:hypothetical protein